MARRIAIGREALKSFPELSLYFENRGFDICAIEDIQDISSTLSEGNICNNNEDDKKTSIVMLSDKVKSLRKQGTLGAMARKCGADRVLSIDNKGEFSFNISMGGSLGEIVLHEDTSQFQKELMCYFLSGPNAIAARDRYTLSLLSLAKKVAETNVTAMIVGDTGTGKEVIAQYIHKHSSRSDKPFIAVNCAAVPDNMLEAMLFGYEKGAFTGAHQSSKGLFRAADGGSLLLDEVSEMPLGLQSKLLRVLQEREVSPLGGSQTIAVDIRVIATSNRNMALEAKLGRFREDLYYRLNVFPLKTGSLKDRLDDIVPISVALIVRHSLSKGAVPGISDIAASRLLLHNWPGNVRELDNVLQRALVLSGGQNIDESHLVIDEINQTLQGDSVNRIA